MIDPSPAVRPLRRRLVPVAGLAIVAGLTLVSACAPTIRLQVDPIQIYAKLDADVRVRLDQELQQLLRDNPNLF